MKKNNAYEGKLFSVLGDSIITLGGYSEPADAAFYAGDKKFEAEVFTPEDTWWGIVIAALGGELLVNNSISGSMVSDHPCCFIPSYGCSEERTSSLGGSGKLPDVVMVLLGTNDWGCGVRVLPCDESESADPCVFSVAYELMLAKLKKNYPNAEIWCLTLPVSTHKQQEMIEFPYRSHGRHIEEYCAVIRNTAVKYGCGVIDLYAENMMLDTIDGYHPNLSGMKAIADAVLSNVENW